jgi:predicted double-glycine peptidase
VLGLMLILLLYYCVAPFLAPAFNRGYWLQAQTRIDRNNICIQRTDYDCGPAAAVTALRALGLPAKEGEIVILSHCTSVMGTPPDVLSNALQKRYGNQGLFSQYRYFNSVVELAEAGLVLAVIRYGLLEDHYVTVFKADAQQIVAGDPSRGLVVYPTAEFVRVWRHTGIQLSRAKGRLVEAEAHSSSAFELAGPVLPAP